MLRLAKLGRRPLDLDRPIDLSAIDLSQQAAAKPMFHHLLHHLLLHDCRAMHAFYHEERSLIRTCYWAESPAYTGWAEYVPMPEEVGALVIAIARTHASLKANGIFTRRRLENRVKTMVTVTEHWTLSTEH